MIDRTDSLDPVKNYAISLIIGVVIGYLGHRIVQALRPSSPANGAHIYHLLNNRSFTLTSMLGQDLSRRVPHAELNNLRRSVGWKERNESMWQEMLASSTHTVCVIKNHQLVGYGCLLGNGRMGTLYDIHVRPDHQKQGIGTLIMNDLIQYIQSKDYVSVGLFGWEENSDVLNFYRKFGFTENPYAMEASAAKLECYKQLQKSS